MVMGTISAAIPPQQRESVFAQIREQLKELAPSTDIEQSYIYDADGRVSVKTLRMEGYEQRLSFAYNEDSDTDVVIFQTTDSPTFLNLGEQYLEVRHVYVYDQHGNWTEQTTAARTRRDEPFRNSATQQRSLTYY